MVLAEDLRQAVLQAALQGKLTEQLDTDSDVDEMLANIQVEKEKIIANKKIKKEKSLHKILEEDIPFDIPDNWKFAQLGEIALYLDAGKSPDCIKENVIGDEWGVITTTAIQVNNFCENENKRLPKDFVINRDIKIEPNDILITRAGPMTRTGIMCLVENIQFNLLLSDKTVRVNIDNKNINKKFIVNAINSPCIRLQIINMMSGMDKQQVNISQEKIRKIIIPIPPIEEQQRIVDKINEIMPKINEYEKIEKELEVHKKEFPINMKDALLQAAMQGKLTEQLESDSSVDELLLCIEEDRKNKIRSGLIKKDKRLFTSYIDDEDVSYTIPSNWRGVTIGSIVYKLTDGTHKTPKYAIDGVKFVSVKDMSSGKLDLSNTKLITQEEHEELYKRCNPEKGDILLSKVGTTGVPAIIDTDEQFSLFVSVALLKYNHQFINEKFLYYLLMSPLVQEQVRENTRGIGNKNWVLDFIAKTVIVLPPIEEQQRIVERLNTLLPLCEELME